jgi:FlgD Ig-like domain
MKKINLLLILLLISSGQALRMKKIVYLPHGLDYAEILCADTDHNDSNELIFTISPPTRWEIWEYCSLNQYQLVYADTGVYPPQGIATGNFEPNDVGDIDQDSLTDLLGPNVDFPSNPDTFYNVVTTQESPNYSSYPETLSWWYRYTNNYAVSEPFYFPPDLDRDGRREIIFEGPHPTANQLVNYIFENIGNNQNVLVFADTTGPPPNTYTFGDFDLDGRMEFVSSDLMSIGRVFAFENTGDDQYSLVWIDTVHIPNGSDVFSGNDLDGDGKPEFFVGFAQYVGGITWDFYLYMWEATGNNSYQRVYIDHIRSVDWLDKRSRCGDIDGDGIEELIWSIGGIVEVYKATGNNQFQGVWVWVNDFGGEFPHSMVNIYDMNRDGYNEVIISGYAGNGISKTSIFEVEAVQLRRPNGGEIFQGGTQELIRWQTFHPPRCDSLSLFYSLNNGRTYDTIITGISGADTSYLWTVPDTSSDSCKVKIIAYGPGWQLDESDGVFTITPSGIGEIASPLLAMTSIDISPNPAKGKIRFRIWNANKGLTLKIYNLAGELLKSLILTTKNQKLTTIFWDGKDDKGKQIPTGVYIYRLKTTDGISETKDFIIIK